MTNNPNPEQEEVLLGYGPAPREPAQEPAQPESIEEPLLEPEIAALLEEPEQLPPQEQPEPSGEPPILEPEIAALLEQDYTAQEQEPADKKFLAVDADAEFDEMMAEPGKKTPIPSRSRPTRKGRPRRKKGEGFLGIPNILVTAVWLAITLFIGVTLGRMLWVCAADVLAFGRENKTVTITIYETDDIDSITEKLHKANLIRYPGLFKLYAKLAVDEGEIRPGIWDLNTMYDYHALVSMMSPSSSRSVVEVMIPEGYSCRQIFALLQENKVCTAQDLASYAATGELDEYWFLDGVDRGDENALEGYLFPDTYQFYTNDSPRNVLQKMLSNFDNRFTEEMRNQLPALNEYIRELMRKDGRSEETIAKNQFTIREVIIVASLIEKETDGTDQRDIASVIYNRLQKPGETAGLLQIDASLLYGLPDHTGAITNADKAVDTPYNLYLHKGLPPTAIANPGSVALKAAMDPNDTDYYYYALGADGKHHFSKTLSEHIAFVGSSSYGG